MDRERKLIPLKIIGLLLAAIFLLWGMQWWSKIRNQDDIDYRTKEVDISLREAIVAKQIADLKAPPQKAADTKSSFDCNYPHSSENGYFSKKVHQIGGSEQLTVRGCMWASANKQLRSLSGKDFLIEFPDPSNASNSYKCPNAVTSDCAVFLNDRISESPNSDKSFRIIINPNGYLSIL